MKIFLITDSAFNNLYIWESNIDCIQYCTLLHSHVHKKIWHSKDTFKADHNKLNIKNNEIIDVIISPEFPYMYITHLNIYCKVADVTRWYLLKDHPQLEVCINFFEVEIFTTYEFIYSPYISYIQFSKKSSPHVWSTGKK